MHHWCNKGAQFWAKATKASVSQISHLVYYMIISKENLKVAGVFFITCLSACFVFTLKSQLQLGYTDTSWLQGQKTALGTFNLQEQLRPSSLHWAPSGPSAIREIFHRLSEAGFHPGVIPQPRQRLSRSARLGRIRFLREGCQCRQHCSRPHVNLASPNRYHGRARQEASAGGFYLRL